VRELSTHCLKLLKKAGLETMTPEPWEERAQIVNVLVPDAEKVMNALREKHRIVVNVKDDAIRISVGFFNTEEELDKAVSAIKRETSGRGAVAA
jgi:selenocysteine lyase/cysteine desulfurase